MLLSHRFLPDIGGIEVNSEIFATEFNKMGHEVRVVTWTRDSEGRDFTYRTIRDPNIFELLKLHLWADVVFENNPCLRLSWPNLIINRPLIVALRTWIMRVDGSLSWQDKLKLKWLKRAKAVIAVSEAVRKKTWNEAIVIGNPYRSEVFKILPVDKEKSFVFLGRLVTDKGVNIAIDVIKKINDNQRTNRVLKLHIIGDGPEKENIQKIIVEYKAENYIKLCGSLAGSDLVNELNKHNFIIIPSLWEEPFGNVALEGMACGCLPIVSDGGGLPDAVGKAGIVFKRGDLNNLEDIIVNIINDPDSEKQYKYEAFQHLDEHTPEKVSEKYMNVIKSFTKN